MSGKLFWQIVILIVIYAVIMSATKIGMKCSYQYMPSMQSSEASSSGR